MRIAIFTLGSRGDIQPYVALAKEAIKNGHSAIICTGKTFEKFILDNGVEFKKADSDLMAVLQTKEGKEVFENPLAHPIKIQKLLKEVINPTFRKSLDQFFEACQDADIIIYHPKAFGATDIASVLEIPCVSMPPVPMTYPIDEFPNLAISPIKNFGKKINRLTYSLVKKGESANIKELNDFRQNTLNLPKRKSGAYTFDIDGKAIPVVYPVSNALFEDVTSWNNKVYLPGFFFLDTDEQELDHNINNFISKGPAPIVVSFSSMPLKNPDKFKYILEEAITKTNNRAIVLTGISGLSFDDNQNILCVKSAPHTLLFPEAKGIVHHGGVGTMASALKSGRPQVIMPFSVDQPFWANRLYNQGYALKPLSEKTLTVDELASRLIEMDNVNVQSRAKEIQSKINSENGTENAVKYLEYIHNTNNL